MSKIIKPKIQVGVPCFSYEGDCESYINFAIQTMLLTAKNPKEIEFIIGLNSDNINTDILYEMKDLCYGIRLINVMDAVGQQQRTGESPNTTQNTESSLNHGEVLDLLFELFDSTYGMWIDADMAFLADEWDNKLKLELDSENVAIVGMEYPKNRNH